MKLSAETPPDGDFVRYLALIERESPTYQALRPTDDIGAVRRFSLAEYLREGASRAAAAGARPDRQPEVFGALKDTSRMQKKPVAAVMAPLLQRLEQALAAARDAQASPAASPRNKSKASSRKTE